MRTHDKSSLFLMEMIVAILFFALSAAICVQLFVRSQQLNEDSTNLIAATNLSRNIAETYKNDSLKDHYPYDDKGNLYYDASWQKVSKPAHYTIHLHFQTNSLTITVKDAKTTLYTLTVSHYQPKKVKA